MLSMLGKNFSRQHFDIFFPFFFFKKIGFDILCNLSPVDNLQMPNNLHETSNPISGKKDTKKISLSTAEFAHSIESFTVTSKNALKLPPRSLYCIIGKLRS